MRGFLPSGARGPGRPRTVDGLLCGQTAAGDTTEVPPGMTGRPESFGEERFMDVFSDVLRAVRLSGAVFYEVDTQAPWAAAAEAAEAQAQRVMPGFPHVMEFHVVSRGRCWVSLAGQAQPSEQMQAGSIVVFPHGDAHVLSSEEACIAEPGHGVVRHSLQGDVLPFFLGEGAANDLSEDPAGRARLLCGFLGCDLKPFNPVVQALPRMLHVRASLSDADDVLGNLVHATAAESRRRRPGHAGVLARLSELLFIEVVRRHFEGLPPGQRGWFGALADPQLGRALRLMHAEPGTPWTLSELARHAAMSRSVLVERFGAQLGLSPMAYLVNWRMQLACGMLAGSQTPLARIAEAVGYQSEAAFSRAFKRCRGVSPAHWRRQRAGG
jgi:AraC-like DNA-binding protein